jgi:hypothetical protein
MNGVKATCISGLAHETYYGDDACRDVLNVQAIDAAFEEAVHAAWESSAPGLSTHVTYDSRRTEALGPGIPAGPTCYHVENITIDEPGLTAWYVSYYGLDQSTAEASTAATANHYNSLAAQRFEVTVDGCASAAGTSGGWRASAAGSLHFCCAMVLLFSRAVLN